MARAAPRRPLREPTPPKRRKRAGDDDEPVDADVAADDWDNILARLNERGISPLEFRHLTYPQLIAILTDGKSGKSDTDVDRKKKLMADLKSGKYAAAIDGVPATFKSKK